MAVSQSHNLDIKPEICALIVTHQLGSDISSTMRELLASVDKIIIIDNGSRGEHVERICELSAEYVEIIWNPSNLGIAAAINQGMIRARELGFGLVLVLDQDSYPSTDMVQSLLRTFQKASQTEMVAIVAPMILDPVISHEYTYLRSRFGILFERVPCSSGFLGGVTMVLNSGALHSIKAIENIGRFRDDFFIDYVDTEYCLRALTKGYSIHVACDAVLEHRLGARERRKIGQFSFLPTFHSPVRWYYISRNRIPMLRMYAIKFPHWLSFEILSSLYIFLRMLLFEDQRLLKLKAFFYGTLDGLRGRMGRIRPKLARRLGGES